MDRISIKLIRIASRIFDAAVRIRKAFNETIDGVTFKGKSKNDGAMEDNGNIVIFGEVEADNEVKGKTILFEEDGTLEATLVNCRYNGGAFNGTFKGGEFSGRFQGVFDGGDFNDGEFEGTFNDGNFNNGIMKGTFVHGNFVNGTFNGGSIFINSINNRNLANFNGRIIQELPNGKNDLNPVNFIDVENASFSISSNDKSGFFMTWKGGTTSGFGKKGIVINGKYNNISSKFTYGNVSFATTDATFMYNGKMEWDTGTEMDKSVIPMNFNGTYGTNGSTGFTGHLKVGSASNFADVTINDGHAIVNDNKITQLKAPKLTGNAKFKGFSINNEMILGDNNFKCENATFTATSSYVEWDSGQLNGDKNSIISNAKWKDGTFNGATWCYGMWLADDSNWLGGYEENGTQHPAGDSPRKWGTRIRTVGETEQLGLDENGNPSFKTKQVKKILDDNGTEGEVLRTKNYGERYKIMRDCLFDNNTGDLAKDLDFSDTTKFGKLEQMLQENPRRPNRIDALYSNGVRVIYENEPNLKSNGKLNLKMISVEFLDPSILRKIYEDEIAIKGFTDDGEFITESKPMTWKISTELKKHSIAIAQSGLYDGIKVTTDGWYDKNGQQAKNDYDASYAGVKDKTDDEVDSIFMDERVRIDAWKYLNSDYLLDTQTPSEKEDIRKDMVRGIRQAETYNQNLGNHQGFQLNIKTLTPWALDNRKNFNRLTHSKLFPTS